MPIYFRFRELRHALGLTQAELARRAGVRRATVSRLENARVSAIDLDVLERLANVLGIEPGFLLSRTEPVRRPSPARHSPTPAASAAGLRPR
jgi:Predicted transcriptional regulator